MTPPAFPEGLRMLRSSAVGRVYTRNHGSFSNADIGGPGCSQRRDRGRRGITRSYLSERRSEGLAGVFRLGATRAIQQEPLSAGDLGAHPVRLLRRGCR